jgi:predicted negative regulator of RcsB-dependent stress response
MAEQNAFDKLHVDEREKADLGGVLDQLNLPPSFVEFIKKNQKIISITLGIISVAVIVWALYGSYAEKKMEESNAALVSAQQLSDGEYVTALQNIIQSYSGTDAATWAQVKLGRYYIEQEAYDKALLQYTTARSTVNDKNSLSMLLTSGIAQVQEALENYEEAIHEYNSLKKIPGYESIAYSGVARIHEIQGDLATAIHEYEQYLGTMTGTPATNPEKAYILEKISNLKALQ